MNIILFVRFETRIVINVIIVNVAGNSCYYVTGIGVLAVCKNEWMEMAKSKWTNKRK